MGFVEFSLSLEFPVFMDLARLQKTDQKIGFLLFRLLISAGIFDDSVAFTDDDRAEQLISVSSQRALP
jgi:hypothetical protein